MEVDGHSVYPLAWEGLDRYEELEVHNPDQLCMKIGVENSGRPNIIVR